MHRGAGEWVSLAGLRTDGRRPHELRRVHCTLGTYSNADGSASLKQGQTEVLAIVHGPHEVTRRSEVQHDKCIIECEFYRTPFSGFDRKKRRPTDRSSLEASLALKQTFETAVMRHIYPRTQIDIQVYVLQSDGSILPAAINAVSLALVDAGIAMKEMVTACSVALLDKQPVLDVTYKEQSSGGAYMPLAAFPIHGEILLIQCEARLEGERLEEMMLTAMEGSRQVSQLFQTQVKEYTRRLAGARLAPPR
ncbi:hypothetical protein NSK_004663 [Nannochloropsis salina CCMP1776]|uniref:Uncharacterized protein n=1 Tax=Nannochloropsis salina CCMP1776 TaxID=1027361 RepID=A0A4D9CZF0_9STRA|nr:hypothetical protein NSK_004663 [Nannochloropsis salina CCMP1776]|eukprot:TFJ83557.1 hypothetical protein NSK_004663 [Nannochloropsis salina CCMP1776]